MEHENQTGNRGYNTQNKQWNRRSDDDQRRQQGDWHQQDDWNQSGQNRVNYKQENEQHYSSGGYGWGQAGNRNSEWGQSNRPSGEAWGDDDRNERREFGNTSYGNQNRDRRDYNNQYGYGGSGGNYGQHDYGRSQLGHQYGAAATDHQNQGYGSSADRYRSDYQDSGSSQYRNNEGAYSGNRQWNDGGNRNWWDRTRDEVASWFGNDDAERRRDAEQHNVTGEHYGKGPRGYQRSQERIKEDVCNRLSDDQMIDASDIEVDVQGNEVILSGKVHSKEEKRRAEDLVERITGVTNVENRLRVDRSAADSWSPSIGL